MKKTQRNKIFKEMALGYSVSNARNKHILYHAHMTWCLDSPPCFYKKHLAHFLSMTHALEIPVCVIFSEYEVLVMFSNQRKCLTEDEVLDILYNDDSGDDLIPELDSNSDSERPIEQTSSMLLSYYSPFSENQGLNIQLENENDIRPMSYKHHKIACKTDIKAHTHNGRKAGSMYSYCVTLRGVLEFIFIGFQHTMDLSHSSKCYPAFYIAIIFIIWHPEYSKKCILQHNIIKISLECSNRVPLPYQLVIMELETLDRVLVLAKDHCLSTKLVAIKFAGIINIITGDGVPKCTRSMYSKVQEGARSKKNGVAVLQNCKQCSKN
ncbi:hypothetical protein C0J52_12649 [Blattella germanica]|nr:hypothetical protein C0J52_12649 [Blattella germanica]